MSGEPVDTDGTADEEPREESPSASPMKAVKVMKSTVSKKPAAAPKSKAKPHANVSEPTVGGISKKPASASALKAQPKCKAQPNAKVWQLPAATPAETEEDDSEEEYVAEVDGVAEEMSFFDDDSSKMDRSKKAKFVAMYEDGSLPQWLADAWQTSLGMKKGRTAEQRRLVNEAFDRDKGHLVLTLDKPAFDDIKDWISEIVILTHNLQDH